METKEVLRPTRKQNRIDLLDIYRGFAILGIFVVNIVIMNSTFLNQDEFAKQWTSNIDRISERILQLFFYTKFFPIFSLLFGLGISMQAIKLQENNNLNFKFFGRRMFILFLIGVFHIIFIWSGDVLNLYAILGLMVTFFLKRSNKIILSLSLLFLIFPFYDQVFSMVYDLINYTPGSYLTSYNGEDVHRVISQGSYLEGIKLRMLEYMENIPMLFGFLAPVALSMFLLGVYIGKNKLYLELKHLITRLTKPAIFIVVISNFYRIVFLYFLPDLDIYSNENFRPVFIKLMVISDVLLGLLYLWIIGWLWYNTKMKFLLKPLRHAGRMALTNYILQSLIGLFIFSSIGLALYETLSPFQTLIMAITVFFVQVILSKIWLKYFRFGPLEWIWRCFTYKKLLSLRKPELRPFPIMEYHQKIKEK